MSNPVSRWVNNVMSAAEKSAEASKIQNSDQALKSSDKAKSKAAEDARGQLWGAILQNRTYDAQGKIKGTQPNHHVTDSNNHTKPTMPSKRPAVGTDKDAKKKYGDSSWNNGYTN